MTTLWRINIKPENGPIEPRKFCLERGFLGVGWRVEEVNTGDEWNKYWSIAKRYAIDGNNRGVYAARRMHDEMKVNDLCWTRDLNGMYYVGRVTGEWEYHDEPEHRLADIINVRACDWLKVGLEDEVPGDVVRSFTRASLQRVCGDLPLAASQYIYNNGSGKEFHYDISPIDNPDIFSALSAFDCEDIVGLYLQEILGYRLVPSTCKSSTLEYEYVLRHPTIDTPAVAQVKSGGQSIDRGKFVPLAESTIIYLFATSGDYFGEEHSNIVCLAPKKMEDFVRTNKRWMPPRIQRWMDIVDELGSLGE